MLGTQNLGAWFDRSLRVNRPRPAIEWSGGGLSYGDLDAWSRAVAEVLAGQGVGAGDVVALLIGNQPSFIACDVAIARLGAVKLPVNQLLPAHTIRHILQDAGARVLVVGPGLTELAHEAVQDAEAVLVLEVDTPGSDTSGVVSLPPSGSSPPSSSPLHASVGPEAPAAIYYTGGTTGLPKGVEHSQQSLVSFHVAQLLEAEIRQQDRLLLHTPLAHAAGLFAQSALLRGATIVLRDGFDPVTTLAEMRDKRITWTFLVPTMIYRLLDEYHTDAESAFPDLATVVYGAAPIAPSRLKEALEVFGPVFIQLYGQTECPNWGTRLVKTDHLSEGGGRLASCGQASAFVDVMVVDEESGRELPAGDTGEICLRGPYTLTRYHANPEATREKFLGEWIRTGDIGVLDEAGYLYLKDRRADMIITGGMNVYCREVEDVLNAHPQVRAVAVIGIPHDDWGEAVHAVVVRDGELGAAELLTWARPRLAAYARPKAVEFVDRLPETPFGKVDKTRLREPYWGNASRGIH